MPVARVLHRPKQSEDRRACAGRHPPGNGHRVAMPRDERGIAMIGQGKKASTIRLRGG